MAAVMLGNGIVGIAANLLRAVTLMLFPASKGGVQNKDNSFYGAMIFFSICAAFCLINALLMRCLMKNKCGIYFMTKVESPVTEDTDAADMMSAETLDRGDENKGSHI